MKKQRDDVFKIHPVITVDVGDALAVVSKAVGIEVTRFAEVKDVVEVAIGGRAEFKITKYSSTVSHSAEIGRAAVSMEKKAISAIGITGER